MGHEEIRKSLLERISLVNEMTFHQVALDLFQFQAQHNAVYRHFLNLLSGNLMEVSDVSQIPFLPIEIFKHREIKTGSWDEEVIFESSGAVKSQHFGRSLTFYHQHAIEIFEDRFGGLNQYEVFGLLPHYLRAGQSSLVSMVKAFMKHSGQDKDHFFLDDFPGLVKAIGRTANDRRPLLFGVTYALIDFANAHPASLPSETLVFETGGMKGRREEWSKTQLHNFLKDKLKLASLYSEYGMTELFSQAYASAGSFYQWPKSMKILFKEINDPTTEVALRKVGVAHIIDLANIDTCSFIASADLGINHGKLGFEILGRVQNADLRGCQLLYL